MCAPNAKLTRGLQNCHVFRHHHCLWQDVTVRYPSSTMKILIVEDEPKTGDYLKQGLTEAGFVADLARDGWDGLEMAKASH